MDQYFIHFNCKLFFYYIIFKYLENIYKKKKIAHYYYTFSLTVI